MSAIPDEIRNKYLKYDEILNNIGFSVDKIIIETNECSLYIDISISSIIVHNLRVTKFKDHCKIELPIGIQSPWSTPIPVISFYNNEFWCAIRYGIEKYLNEISWVALFFDENKI